MNSELYQVAKHLQNNELAMICYFDLSIESLAVFYIYICIHTYCIYAHVNIYKHIYA